VTSVTRGAGVSRVPLSSQSPTFSATDPFTLRKRLTDSMRTQRTDTLSTLIRREPVSYVGPRRFITRACSEMMHVQCARISSKLYAWHYCACIKPRISARGGRRSAPDSEVRHTDSLLSAEYRTHLSVRRGVCLSITIFPFPSTVPNAYAVSLEYTALNGLVVIKSLSCRALYARAFMLTPTLSIGLLAQPVCTILQLESTLFRRLSEPIYYTLQSVLVYWSRGHS
jgi:hypothetical protein